MKWRKQCCKCKKTFYKEDTIQIGEKYIEDYFDFETGSEGHYKPIYKFVCPYCKSPRYIIV